MTRALGGRTVGLLHMGVFMRTILFLSAAAVALSACGPADEGSALIEDGQTVDYDTSSASANSEIRIADANGGETVINSSAGSADLPDGYSVYPDATVVSSTVMNQSDGQGTLIIMQSDAEPEQLVKFYRQQAQNAGIEIGMEMTSNGMMMIAGETDDGGTFSFSASPSEGGTTGQLVVGKGLN